MAAVVYEGTVGGDGDLFAGIKFFVMQRVPMRETYREAIQRNGGELMKFEKHADIIIADHARRDTPIGSISWTFIDKSVARGRLEDLEKHRAGPREHTVREVSSTQPTRSGRTAFTAQDDRDLFIWITKAERSGASVRGNEIYKQLEAINPRHTLQSWRDRWVKRLADWPRPEISEEEISAAPGYPVESKYSNHLPPSRLRRTPSPDDGSSEVLPASQIQPGPSTQPRCSPSLNAKSKPVTNKANDKHVEAKSTTVVALVRESTGGMTFTEAEANHMLEYYDVMAEVDQKRGVDAWAKYSIENPNHSAQEWHDYFTQTIRPLMKKQRQISKGDSKLVKDSLSATSAADVCNDTHEEAPKKDQSQMAAQPSKVVDPTTEDEKLFMEGLSLMAEYQGNEVNFEPVICGRRIKLFQLWQIVNSDEFGGYEEVVGRGLWRRIAGKLNFNDFKHPKAADAIKAAYEILLPDFEVSRQEYMQILQEEEMIQLQLRATADRASSVDDGLADEEVEIVREEEEEEDDYDDNLGAPASLPSQIQPSFSKRNLESDGSLQQDGPPLVKSQRKRQRIDKGKGILLPEIPSTPDNIINPSWTPRHTEKSSPLKLQQSAAEEGSDSGEDLQRPLKLLKLPIQRQTKQALEPETQDFNFRSIGEDAELGSSLQSLPNLRRKRSIDSEAHSIPHEDRLNPSPSDFHKEQQLFAFIEHYVALGYPQEIVVQALESTNMTTGNAAIVMEELMRSNEIPENIQGVWTAKDDEALDAVDSEEFERITMKHGTKNVVLRQKYFMYRARSEVGGNSV